MLDERLTQPRSTPLSRRECFENIDQLTIEAQLANTTDERKIEIYNELQVWETELSHAKNWERSIITLAQRQHMREHTTLT